MKKLALLCITALGAALLVLGPAPSASAYPELTCTVTVDRQVLEPGQTFTVTGKSQVVDNGTATDSSVRWTFTFDGVTKKRTGATVTARFKAPQVDETRTFKLTARSVSSLGTCERDLLITVLGAQVAGPNPGGGGLMPNTGGPTFWLLVGALALLLVGGGTVVATRRRD